MHKKVPKVSSQAKTDQFDFTILTLLHHFFPDFIYFMEVKDKMKKKSSCIMFSQNYMSLTITLFRKGLDRCAIILTMY